VKCETASDHHGRGCIGTARSRTTEEEFIEEDNMTVASTLFEPLKIGFQEFKNRLAIVSMTRSLALVWLLPY
jgi:hypothetical protein